MTDPVTKTTATKANASALMVVAMAVLAYFGVGEMPDAEALSEALQTTGGLLAYALGTAIASGATWLTTYFTRNKEITAGILPTLLALSLVLAACGSYTTVENSAGQETTLSADQLAYKVVGDYTAMQTAAVAIVENPQTPPKAKLAIQAAEAVAFDAVDAYVKAVHADAGDLALTYSVAISSLTRLLDVLVANGWLNPDLELFARGGAPPGVDLAALTTGDAP